jgi:predicted nucleic-acid-binding Zn-ribbon protein
MKPDSKCLKCGGVMEEGFVKSEGGYVGNQKWGTESNWRGNMKEGKDVITHRCKNCGYLESYAN